MQLSSRDCFRKICRLWIVAGAVALALSPTFAFSGQQSDQKPCSEYADRFDTFNPERWQEVLLYSKARGTVSADNGWLSIGTPEDEPCEIQVYSLFCFDGDFDIQADYDLSDSKGLGLPLCRFNTGLVVQTLGDERSFKCYIAAAQKEDFLFRARLDVSGEKNLEKYKGRPAPKTGVIRITRKAGQLSFLTRGDGEWQTQYTFAEPCQEKLRVRFKLQTSEDEEGMQACPVTVKFGKFQVNSCDKIVDE
jgi:hypothetical protein